MSRIVLIDTDSGVDDALALILAFRSPELSVKAITTVAGNVEVEKCTQNVLRILYLLHVPCSPVVAQGAAKPLRRALFTAPEVHGADGLGNVGRRFPQMRTPTRSQASDVILECCRQYGKRLMIVALGPLTNLAKAWRKSPAAFEKVGRVISMGGALRVPGNTGPVAEFNYYVDPEAAQQVLKCGVPFTMIPLDVTEQVAIMRRELEYRAKRRASKLASAVLRFTSFYMRYHRTTEGFYGGYLHDPIAVAAAIDPTLFQTRRIHVDVETQGRYTRGMTISDLRKPSKNTHGVIEVAFKIDRDRFLKLFHDRIWS